jgi:uncharacterized protein (TIGR00730 family)
MNYLCVFCGSRPGNNAAFADAARDIGRGLVQRGWGLVYGGGHIGMMGVLADAVLASDGAVIGVIPRSMVERELAHPGLKDLRLVGTMHERKALMADLSSAFLALPGAYGTLDELFEILTWRQLKLHDKPIGLLNTAGYYDPLLTWIDRALEADFLKPKYRDLLIVDGDPQQILDDLLRSRGR